MKNFIVLGTLLFTVGAYAALDAEKDTQYIRAIRMNACSFWNYSNEARGYVCGSYPSSESVADADSVESENRELRSRIDDLERRIQKLEAKP